MNGYQNDILYNRLLNNPDILYPYMFHGNFFQKKFRNYIRAQASGKNKI